jgi:cobalt transporter subunit CbtB
MKNEVKAIALTQTQSRVNSDVMGIAGALMLGTILLFAAGFAQATIMHDTAHDTRHAMAFPCH